MPMGMGSGTVVRGRICGNTEYRIGYYCDRWVAIDRQLEDSSKTITLFPSDTVIGPGEYIVLFGGGDITKIKSEFEGKVFVDDGKIGGGLSNSGDAVFLINPLQAIQLPEQNGGKKEERTNLWCDIRKGLAGGYCTVLTRAEGYFRRANHGRFSIYSSLFPNIWT